MPIAARRLLRPRLILNAALALGAVAMATAVDARRDARADGAWCATAGGHSGYSNCGYYSFRQCQAAVSGVGGMCSRNPDAGTIVIMRRPGRVYYEVW